MAAAARRPALLRLLCIVAIASRRLCIAFAPPSSNEIVCRPATTRTSTRLNSQDGPQEDGAPTYSGLKSLLPTPRKRTLKLDKYGRRIHDMGTDHSPAYTKAHDGAEPNPASSYAGPAEPSPAMRSDHDATLAQQTDDGPVAEGDSPSLSQISGVRSTKEMAAEASSGDFRAEVKVSADLKALLPQQKMRFMKLDKHGRRIHRMEDDNTANLKKEPSGGKIASHRGTRDGFGSPNAVAGDEPTGEVGRPLAELLSKDGKFAKKLEYASQSSASVRDEVRSDNGDYQTPRQPAGRKRSNNYLSKSNDDGVLPPDERGADLKDLLPKQKMKFMKLDKFGRRVQSMEDDTTVNYTKSRESDSSEEAEEVPGGDADAADEASIDLGQSISGTGASNYGSLKDLLPTKRATWTKLDFKGGSVEDERRTKPSKSTENVVSTSGSEGGLQALLPKKPSWTKLDFHGVGVEDTSRTQSSRQGSSEAAASGFSSLRDHLPDRTITWKREQTLSAGIAASARDSVRETRRAAMKDAVISSAGASSANEVEDGAKAEPDENDYLSGSSLRDLLPKKKFAFREIDLNGEKKG